MNNYKLNLLPLELRLRLGRYDYNLESDGDRRINLSTIGINHLGSEEKFKIVFNKVVEYRFFSFNFWEQNYGDSMIKTIFDDYVPDTFDFNQEKYVNYWAQSNICPDSGIYSVENSQWYDEREIYQGLKRNEYYHYLLTGYESYIEILAKNDYEIMEI